MIGVEKLGEFAARATVASANDKQYETWGVETNAVLSAGMSYAQSCLEVMVSQGPIAALMIAFMAGFDIGYLSRMELEKAGAESAPDFVPEDLTEESK